MRFGERAELERRVDLVHLDCFVHLVGLVQPNKPINGFLPRADFFGILPGDR
jgi:hypothetical protein